MLTIVPTMGRTFDTRTISDLYSAKLSPILVVPKREAIQYRDATERLVEIVSPPDSVKGIGLTRRWIMDNWSTEKLVMVDDDLSFHTRRKDDPTKFTPATTGDVKKLFGLFEKHLSSYAHVSMIGRQGGNRLLHDVECSRPWHVFGYNVPRVRAAGAKFGEGLLQDDFDMTLQLLKAGLRNRIITGYAVNQHHGHGAPGGAASYRTVKDHNASVRRLEERHKPFVQVVERAYAGDPWLGKRLETIVAWKKAFASSQS